MSRDTLSDLRSQLRVMGAAGFNDATLGTVTFWSDDHLDAVLDRHRQDVRREQLQARYTVSAGGTPVYQDYYSDYGNFEATSGGTALFVVEDGTGADVTSGYTADYSRGLVTFAANTLGSVYYLTGRSYDLNAAAADVWRTKAAQAASSYDISTDNHSLSRSQIMAQALQMAEYYSMQSGPQMTTLYRSDNGECLPQW